MTRLYQQLANMVSSTVEETKQRAVYLARERLPHGSGFDSGTGLELEASGPDKLVFHTAFHHMNDGMYDGWTDHVVTVTPTFVGHIKIKVSGRNRNDIKDYIAELFHDCLMSERE